MNKKKAKHNDGNDGDEKIVELRIAVILLLSALRRSRTPQLPNEFATA